MTDKNKLAELLRDKSGLLKLATETKYPFVKNINLEVMYNPQKNRGYAETWPINEPGAPSYPRPQNLNINRHGVEIYDPDSFGMSDLAGEAMHIDPHIQSGFRQLQSTLSPSQINELKRQSNDYQMSLDYGQSKEEALFNAVNAAGRGYLVKQWPDSANKAMNYTPEQLNMLSGLLQYVQTGEKPKIHNMLNGLLNIDGY